MWEVCRPVAGRENVDQSARELVMWRVCRPVTGSQLLEGRSVGQSGRELVMWGSLWAKVVDSPSCGGVCGPIGYSHLGTKWATGVGSRLGRERLLKRYHVDQ